MSKRKQKTRAGKPAAKTNKAKPAKPASKKAAKPLKTLAGLRAAFPVPVATPRPDKLRSDTIALNLLIWDTAELESAKVASIASSYRETGTQISRITIRPAGKRFRVVAGRHRCEAAKVVGWTELKYELLPYSTEADKLNADLIEIDENLCRKNLTPATEAALTARRKAIYEKLHPETRAGVSQAAGMNASQGRGRQNGGDVGGLFAESENGHSVTRFTEATAVTAGRSERSVQRAASRGEAIGADNLSRIAHTSLDKGEELDALAKLAPAERKDVIARAAAGEKVSAKAELKKQTRSDKEEKLGELQLALPDKKYGVILADPEWRFEPWSRETGMSRSADNHYPTSCTEVIAARDVPSIAADDCVLFLCATAPMLPHALLVMAAWGFNYVSNYVLEKDRIITGYWNRNKHEHLLIGTRGKIMCPAAGTQWESIIAAPVGKHSKKPAGVLDMIEQYFPTLPKIELNRRGPARPGWDAWGNEALPAEADPAKADGEAAPAPETAVLSELEALETIDNEQPLDAAILAGLKEQKLVRGSVKPMLTKAGIARLAKLRAESDAAEFTEVAEWKGLLSVDAGNGIGGPIIDGLLERGLISRVAGNPGLLDITEPGRTRLIELNAILSLPAEVTVDCRVCSDGGGLCAQCLPAESHVISMTSCEASDHPAEPVSMSVATCRCGFVNKLPFGARATGEQDTAIKAHWQNVVAEARADACADDGLGVPDFLKRPKAAAA